MTEDQNMYVVNVSGFQLIDEFFVRNIL